MRSPETTIALRETAELLRGFFPAATTINVGNHVEGQEYSLTFAAKTWHPNHSQGSDYYWATVIRDGTTLEAFNARSIDVLRSMIRQRIAEREPINS